MKSNLFLVKASNGKEAVMKLPIGRCGGITTKGFKMIRERFYEGETNTYPHLKYALNLEQYSNASDLMKALENYQNNIL